MRKSNRSGIVPPAQNGARAPLMAAFMGFALGALAACSAGAPLAGIEPKIALHERDQTVLDYVKAGKTVFWQDDEGEHRGTISVSQIFKVGEMNCRRFVRRSTPVNAASASVYSGAIRAVPRTVKATACRAEGEDWVLVP